jgi:hypothetical protein
MVVFGFRVEWDIEKEGAAFPFGGNKINEALVICNNGLRYS